MPHQQPEPDGLADTALSSTDRKEPPPPAPVTTGVPARIGRFILLECIGSGAMGDVYAAYDEQLDRKVAVKLVRPLKVSTQAQQRLLREARSLAQLSHPNIVHVYESGTHAGSVFIAMEFVRGQHLGAWLDSTKELPSRQRTAAILRLFAAAGRGLEAAHRVGLVHRDFKPENVLVGDDDRVRVVDFGMARSVVDNAVANATEALAEGSRSEVEDGTKLTGQRIGHSTVDRSADGITVGTNDTNGDDDVLATMVAAPPAPHRERAPHQPGDNRAGESGQERLTALRLTATGAIIGTPRYMSPEQMLGQKIDHRSDQFSFCVALYWALYSEWPYSGENFHDLMQEVTSGQYKIPSCHSVPIAQHVRQALLRGLSRVPDDRFSDMGQLLDAIDTAPIRRRRRLRAVLGAATAAVLVVAVALIAWMQGKDAADPCDDVGELMTGVWDDDERAQVRAAFLATGGSYAADTASRVSGRLDPYATEWLEMRERQCRAPRDGLTQARAVCMSQRRDRLAALVAVLGSGGGDTELITRAVQAAENLPLLADCNDDGYLSARVPPPDDPTLRQRVAAIQPRVARLEVLWQSGKYRDGIAEGEALWAEMATETDEIDYPPILAEALYWMAKSKASAGEYEAAEVLAEQCIHTAARAKDDIILAKGWSALLEIVGAKQQRIDDAKPLMRWMEMLANRADDALTSANALRTMAIVLTHQGNYAEALTYHRRSLAIREKVLGPDHLYVAQSLNNIAVVLSQRGNYGESLEHLRRALAMDERVLGPDHPTVIAKLNNIGLALYYRGEYTAAMEHHQRALAIRENLLGPDHLEVIGSLNNIARVMFSQGDYEGALAHYRRSLAIWHKALGPDPEHPDVAYALTGLGSIHLKQGGLDEAGRHLEHARAIREKALGSDHPRMAGTLLGLGQLALGRNQPQRAVELIERGLLLENAEYTPELHLAHAEVLWARNGPGDRARAVQAATKARDAYAAIPNEPKRAEAEAWLATHVGDEHQTTQKT